MVREEEGEQGNVPGSGSDRNWMLGPRLRGKGSVHSDVWMGTAAELAERDRIAVFPVAGWWKDRPHLNRWSSKARYALIVTIETDETKIDIYTPIANMIGVPVESIIEVS